ncbi:MAG TPA: hypothetical protein VGM11_00725 [Acidobacteriaceae bacterium]|jgi:hypothetical protein
MRRTALLLVAVSMCAAAVEVAAEKVPTAKWTVVEMSVKPRSDGNQPAWTVRLQADGAGTYSESGTANPATTPLTVTAATLERVKQGEHAAKSGRCETKSKNIAQTGEKTIRYVDGQRTSECTFNYSDDAGLMGAMATFEAIAETMQYGERLEHELRYDRLGLDAEIDQLVEAKQKGSAIEIANITPILQALVADDHVIDRVRRKAARLLQDAGSPVPAGFDPSER